MNKNQLKLDFMMQNLRIREINKRGVLDQSEELICETNVKKNHKKNQNSRKRIIIPGRAGLTRTESNLEKKKKKKKIPKKEI